jgi:hypothetical protein
MIVITTREFRENQFMELMPRGEIIPESVNPSNDPYFDNPRNIEAILKASEQHKNGKSVKLTPELRKELFENL